MLLGIIEKFLYWMQAAPLQQGEALLKILNFKLCITICSLVNSTLWLLWDQEDFQEEVVMTFYTVPSGVWKYQTTELEPACSLFMML